MFPTRLRGAKFKSLHDTWCDTSMAQGELLVTVLAGFATFERHLIKARTDDGRKRARARGVRFGRPPKLNSHQRQEAMGRLAKGETLVDVARTYGVDPTTIGRLQPVLSPAV
jgi:DNA invertase Pin-like site-specific DNA recombinase